MKGRNEMARLGKKKRKERSTVCACQHYQEPWTPFVPMVMSEKYRQRMEDAEGFVPDNFINSRYQVAKFPVESSDPNLPPMVHLSICTLDRLPLHDWRDFQRIKNELVGPECEAVEIYPAESRLADSANQYHLWAFLNPGHSIPFGFTGGRFVTEGSVDGLTQRPFPVGEKPKDCYQMQEGDHDKWIAAAKENRDKRNDISQGPEK